MITVCAFLILLVIPLALYASGRASEADAADLIKTIAAVVGGPAGIVVGFYFSQSKTTGA